jgi:antirestriction protein ArdC
MGRPAPRQRVSKLMAKHQSTYDKITTGIIAAVERNPGAPKMPWHTAAGHTLLAPANGVTKAHYRGINILLLWIAAAERGFPSSHWGSYKQWASVGGQVRGGETATRIVFFKEFDVDPTSNPAGGPTDNPKDDGKRMTARTYSVFNAAQVDGVVMPDVAPEPDHGPLTRHAAFDAFVAATGAEIVWMGHSAYYRPSTDTITMPAAHLFHGTATMERSESAMAVLAHELTHWSGAKHRLDRDFSKRFKTLEIAGEELVALSGQSGCGLS